MGIRERTANIKTFGRFRPLNELELQLQESQLGEICVAMQGETQVSVGREKACFTLDKIYDPKTPQDDIYREVGHPIIEEVMEGYNGTLFAYGPTGSGKTHTMYGDLSSESAMGVIPRAVKHIFKRIQAD